MRHLDTNTVSALLNAMRGAEMAFTRHYPRVALSAIALAELRFGIANSAKANENTRRLEDLLRFLGVVIFDAQCAVTYGLLRKALRDKGRSVPDADLFIAATAMTHDAVLVTHNTRDFDNIEGLQLEDWLA